MRLIALVATALTMLAGTASANVFDPEASFVSLRIAGLYGTPQGGNKSAPGNASLTGPNGSEVIVLKGMGMGLPDLFAVDQFTNGAEFFTGTPNITNIFLTMQNGDGTFTQGATRGFFQGNTLCPANCFGGHAPLKGQTITEILGVINAVTPVGIVGNSGVAAQTANNARFTTSNTPLGDIKAEGAQWIAGSVVITNIATNIIEITSGPRSGQTGIGMTLQVTPFEDSAPTASGENGVIAVGLGGTTSFSAATGGTGVNQVTLVSPVHIDASTLTGNPPVPGAGVMTLRYVPEPGTMLLLGSAVAGLLAIGRKRMKR